MSDRYDEAMKLARSYLYEKLKGNPDWENKMERFIHISHLNLLYGPGIKDDDKEVPISYPGFTEACKEIASFLRENSGSVYVNLFDNFVSETKPEEHVWAQVDTATCRDCDRAVFISQHYATVSAILPNSGEEDVLAHATTDANEDGVFENIHCIGDTQHDLDEEKYRIENGHIEKLEDNSDLIEGNIFEVEIKDALIPKELREYVI